MTAMRARLLMVAVAVSLVAAACGGSGEVSRRRAWASATRERLASRWSRRWWSRPSLAHGPALLAMGIRAVVVWPARRRVASVRRYEAV
jgi:hypothetical protein